MFSMIKKISDFKYSFEEYTIYKNMGTSHPPYFSIFIKGEKIATAQTMEWVKQEIKYHKKGIKNRIFKF